MSPSSCKVREIQAHVTCSSSLLNAGTRSYLVRLPIPPLSHLRMCSSGYQHCNRTFTGAAANPSRPSSLRGIPALADCYQIQISLGNSRLGQKWAGRAHLFKI